MKIIVYILPTKKGIWNQSTPHKHLLLEGQYFNSS